MKTLLIVLATCATLSMPVHAKQPEAPDLTPIAEQMQLNPEQTERLNELVQQHHAQMKGMHQQRKQAQRQQHDDRHAMRQQHRENLLSVLSYEQLYQFENYMHQQRQQRRQQRAASKIEN